MDENNPANPNHLDEAAPAANESTPSLPEAPTDLPAAGSHKSGREGWTAAELCAADTDEVDMSEYQAEAAHNPEDAESALAGPTNESDSQEVAGQEPTAADLNPADEDTLPVTESVVAQSAAPTIADILGELIAADQELLQRDREELAECRETLEMWRLKGEVLHSALAQFHLDVEARLREARESLALVAGERQPAVVNRQQTLDKVAEMLGRRVERAQSLSAPGPEEFEFADLDAEQLADAIESSEEEDRRFEAAALVRNEGNRRWRRVRDIREAAEQKRKGYQSFIVGYLLPCTDSFYTGEGFARELLSDDAPEIAAWFGVYGDLQRAAETMLANLQIHEVPVTIGVDRFDERIHVVLEQDKDAPYADEPICEVREKGYMMGADPASAVLLRPVTVDIPKVKGTV